MNRLRKQTDKHVSAGSRVLKKNIGHTHKKVWPFFLTNPYKILTCLDLGVTSRCMLSA